MAINPKELSASNLAALDALLSVANAALETVERIATLNMNTVRSSLKNSAQGTKKVLAAKTPQEAAEAQSAMVQPAIDSANSPNAVQRTPDLGLRTSDFLIMPP